MGSFNKLSPGVLTREIDLTGYVPNVGMSGGAAIGQFVWGPVLEYTIINDTETLVNTYGKPTEVNYVDWFTASSFLAYTGNLNLIRVVDQSTALNATADGLGLLIINDQAFQMMTGTNETAMFAARYPGDIGNSLLVSIADAATFDSWEYKDFFDFAPGTSEHAAALGAVNDEVHVVVVDAAGRFTGIPGSVLETYSFLSKASDAKQLDGAPAFFGGVINTQSHYVRFLGCPTADNMASATVLREITLENPGTGYTTVEVDIEAPVKGGKKAQATAVLAADGSIASIKITDPGSGYETAPAVVITGDGTGASATVSVETVVGQDWNQTCLDIEGQAREFAMLAEPWTKRLNGGNDGNIPTGADIIEGWNMFKNAEEVDVSLLITGQAGGEAYHKAVVQHVIDNIAEPRMDCVVFFSPCLNDVLNKTQSQAALKVKARRENINRSSSYAVMDSGWKLVFDVYHNKYRWIPLNADIAGLCASTDNEYDPWWSPAGFNRGNLKNVVSLAFNPNQTSRDILYSVNVNPVVTFNEDGTVLYGDKTLQAKASAFQFINVRRLFIILEKAISKAAKYQLFEFNDEYTRAQFRAMVEPYLREVKGRRGIYDFRVVCDETNNTPEIIDRAEFIASIFIKPARSINYITLNFVAVRTGVEFSEVVGSV